MSHHIWHAFFYEGLSSAAPPVRTELIEADTDDEAVRIARDHLGDCKRVALEAPRWEGFRAMVIMADEKDTPPSSLH